MSQQYSDKFWSQAAVAPWRTRVDGGEEGGHGRGRGGGAEEEWVRDVRVLAVVHDGRDRDDAPTTVALVNPQGVLVDFLTCPNLADRSRTPLSETRREQDLERLRVRASPTPRPDLDAEGSGGWMGMGIQEVRVRCVNEILEGY